MADMPRTKFNSPWTVAVIEAALNDVSSAKGSSESLTAALNAMRAEINSLSGGVHLKGAVDYYADLPASPSEGDAYTVRYQGTSGTDPLGIEYAWATYQGTPQWIPIGVDPSVFAKQTEMNCVANLGAKNLIDIQHPNETKSTSYTATSNGGVELSCSSATWTQYNISDINVTSGSSYTITFYVDSVSGTNSLQFFVRETSKSGTTLYNSPAISESGTITITVTPSVSKLWFGIYLNNSATAKTASATIRAMLRPAAITDQTFQPYAPTNRELYETKVSKEELYPSDNRTRDINTATAPGTYRFYGNNATANMPSDITVTSAFGLLQVYTVNIYVVQVLVRFTSSGSGQEMPDIYIRRSADSGSNWSPWNKLQGTSVASAQSAASLMRAGRIDASEQTEAELEEEADA